ncbi:plasmid pRiA4b ORF-3 family protein [Filibacter tadaridae]|uniref:Plasmid pRiA4b ORF-3-like protein n=1 Tax=Filibacter tadaridae TaxID=2483811 RepID=A0A3P5XBJ4_9BACL|nr:plasmid pRiA4b ORF-3 family protein [Filibacter tadaridae]VDC27575.1 Plasmid pRiA4b ORF-3-like protein [Filibacter tadaridae]
MKKDETNTTPTGQLYFEGLPDLGNEEIIEKPPEQHANENSPVNLVTDFEKFILYCQHNTVHLTKTKERISRKHLPVINALLTVQTKDSTPYTEQEYYPYIHFLYHVARGGRLLTIVPGKAGKMQLAGTDRVELFLALRDIEKYFFLLETFWIDVDWAKIQNNSRNTVANTYEDVFATLRHETPGKKWVLKNPMTDAGHEIAQSTFDWHFFLLYFEWLGLWMCEEDVGRKEQRGSKSVYFAKNITVTPFGFSLMPILLFSRNIAAWNIAIRRSLGEYNGIPGSDVESALGFILSDEDFEQVLMNVHEDQSDQPFYQPFTALFPLGELAHTLPRNRTRFTEGAYTFNVTYAPDVWRKIVLSAQQTMDDLHKLILHSFQFDDDHLYAFFMDGQKWSQQSIASPHDDSGNGNAYKIQIGFLGLTPTQRFLYINDYIDEWTFTIEVEQIEETVVKRFKPYVKDQKGESPEQYWDYF